MFGVTLMQVNPAPTDNAQACAADPTHSPGEKRVGRDSLPAMRDPAMRDPGPGGSAGRSENRCTGMGSGVRRRRHADGGGPDCGPALGFGGGASALFPVATITVMVAAPAIRGRILRPAAA